MAYIEGLISLLVEIVTGWISGRAEKGKKTMEGIFVASGIFVKFSFHRVELLGTRGVNAGVMERDFDRPERRKRKGNNGCSMYSVRFDYVHSRDCASDSIENRNEAALN